MNYINQLKHFDALDYEIDCHAVILKQIKYEKKFLWI